MRNAKRAIAATCVAAMTLLTGCGFSGIYDLPLPGGADVGDNPIELKVQFRDALDLVPATHVKVNEVPVGRVDDVQLAKDGWHAEVSILLNRSAKLPANALANLKQSSLLGEKYIELVHPPDGTARGKLDNGAVIPLSRTNRNVEVEEILGALSMLLNGGGVEQLNTITKELNNVFTGNEPEIKALMRNATTLARGLNGQVGSIDKALNSANRLAKTLDKDKALIAKALDELPAGMKVLIKQRKNLVTMLQSLRNLSEVATDTMNKSQRDTIDNLRALTPILRNVAEADKIPEALELLVSFPFADSAAAAVKGDYFNLAVNRIHLNVEEILGNFRRHTGHPASGLPILKELPLENPPAPETRVPARTDAPLQLPLDGSGASRLVGSLIGGGS